MADGSASGVSAVRLVQNFFAVDQPAQFFAMPRLARLSIFRLHFLPNKLVAHFIFLCKSHEPEQAPPVKYRAPLLRVSPLRQPRSPRARPVTYPQVPRV